MGSIVPITQGLQSAVGGLNTVNQLVGAVQTLSGNTSARSEQELALSQLQERQRLSEQQLSQQNALERESIATQAAQSEEDRQRALRRAVSRQRANFSSSGVSADGSSQAVLLGLFDESEEELAQRSALDDLRTRALDLNAGQAQSLNLLQATQLRQRQDVSNNLINFGTLF